MIFTTSPTKYHVKMFATAQNRIVGRQPQTAFNKPRIASKLRPRDLDITRNP